MAPANSLTVHRSLTSPQALVYLKRPTSVLPDVLLIDVFFGPTQMTGLQLTQELREGGLSRAVLPIILMSTHSAKEVVEAAYDIGANDWMSKPTNTREVAARVREQARH